MSARCYLLPDILEKLQMPETTFHRLRRAGQLPFVEELQPRLGRVARFRADPVDKYLEGRWDAPKFFAAARRRA